MAHSETESVSVNCPHSIFFGKKKKKRNKFGSFIEAIRALIYVEVQSLPGKNSACAVICTCGKIYRCDVV